LATGGRPRVLAGEVSKKQAARMLSVSKSTVLRLLRAGHEGEDMQIPNATTGRNGGANTGVQNPVENDLAEGA
jgi:transposase